MDAFAMVLGQHGALGWLGSRREAAAQARARHLRGQWSTSEVRQRRQQVHQRHRARDARAALPMAGKAPDPRHAQRALVEAALLDHAAVAHHVAMVAGEDHRGVLGQPGLLQHLHEFAQAAIEVVHHPVEGRIEPAQVVRRHQAVADLGHVVEVVEPGVHRTMAGLEVAQRLRQRHLRLLEARAVRLRDPERVVRRVVVHAGEERRRAGAPAPEVGERLGMDGLVAVVVVRIVVPGLRAHVARPHPARSRRVAGRRLIPVVGEPEHARVVLRGVIGLVGQPLVEAVPLVMADEVHLADDQALVADRPEGVADRRPVGGELVGIVEGPDLPDVAPGDHRGARWRAHRRVAVGALEQHPVVRQPLQVRRGPAAVTMRTGEMRRQRISHHHQDVRTVVALHGSALRDGARVGARLRERQGASFASRQFHRRRACATWQRTCDAAVSAQQ